MLEEPFKPWERGDELLQHYERLTDDPTMIYSGFEDNKDMVVRAIADLFHYCTQKNIDINDVTRKAKALYNSDPKNAKLKNRGVRGPRAFCRFKIRGGCAIIVPCRATTSPRTTTSTPNSRSS